MTQIVGSVVVIGCVVGGFLIQGSSILLLWHPSEIMIIVGSAFGALLTSNPLKVVKDSWLLLALAAEPAAGRRAQDRPLANRTRARAAGRCDDRDFNH